MAKAVKKQDIDALVELTALLMEFAKVNRITYLDTKRTPESDTDHTVMLSVMACAVAAKFCPKLDLGKVAQFALVHDLVEVHTGDIPTYRHTQVDYDAKTAVEKNALVKIKEQFGESFPWIHQTIEEYESLETPEARFVKTLDKSAPALTLIVTDNKQIEDAGDSADQLEEFIRLKSDVIRGTYGKDQPIALKIREETHKRIVTLKRQKENK